MSQSTGAYCVQCGAELMEDFNWEQNDEGPLYVPVPHSCVQVLKERIERLEKRLDEQSNED